MENRYLIAGLGNPGAEYAGTRHNAGFMVVERLAGRWRAKWARDDKFMSRLAKVEHDGRKLMLGEPQTYMNQNGEAGGKLMANFPKPLESLLAGVRQEGMSLRE